MLLLYVSLGLICISVITLLLIKLTSRIDGYYNISVPTSICITGEVKNENGELFVNDYVLRNIDIVKVPFKCIKQIIPHEFVFKNGIYYIGNDCINRKYPYTSIDGTIRRVVCEVMGFDGKVYNNILFDESCFATFKIGEEIPFTYIKPKNIHSLKNHENKQYIQFYLDKPCYETNEDSFGDGYLGIDPEIHFTEKSFI